MRYSYEAGLVASVRYIVFEHTLWYTVQAKSCYLIFKSTLEVKDATFSYIACM